MENIKRCVFCFLYVTIVQLFCADAFAANLSDEEFTVLTGSDVKDVFCVGSQGDENLYLWPEKVADIQLRMNTEKYLGDILKKLKNRLNVSSSNEKYRKIKIKLHGTDCWMSGKYRLTGDLIDHAGINGEMVHSIKVKIKSGKIDNIVKFKLLVPKTRSGKYEVLNTVIHQKLGLLAPRTALVNVQIGGQAYKAIFQEDIREQLLEHNKLHEAILLEGDEGYQPFNFPKIINRSLLANEKFRDISVFALEQLGKTFQLTSGMIKKVELAFPIFLDFLPANSRSEFIYFHLLNFALNSTGGLTLDDSRFVFDHISRRFRPIYYDGHARDSISKVSDINFEIPEEIALKLLKDLEAIELIELAAYLAELGAEFSILELQQIISDSIRFIRAVKDKTGSHKTVELLKETDAYEIIDAQASEIIDSANLSDFHISWMLNDTELRKCIYGKNTKLCSQETLDNSEKLIRQLAPQSLKSGIFLHGLAKGALTPYFQELVSNSVTLLETGTTIEHTRNLELSVDNDTKTVIVTSNENNALTSQIKVSGGMLTGWEFVVNKGVFLGYEQHAGSRASKFGLTGCITFNDLAIKSLKVSIEHSLCEDAIHFVRVQGDVESITARNAFADAIDADFSDLSFRNLKITNAGNDCIDFSAGTYSIAKNIFHDCGDKGVSAGEGSNVFLGNSEISKAVIGIVAKDGSKVLVNEARLSDVDVCLAVYKKKQEYGGAHLNAKNLFCTSDNYFRQNGSLLSLQN